MALIVHTTPIPEGTTALLSLILADENDVPMDDTLTTLTLTYYDKTTEEVINSRDNQDVLNTNNVSFGDSSLGTITCTFLAASRTIRRLTGNWLNTALMVGSQITIEGTASNDGSYTITRISVTDLTVSETLTGEIGVDASFTIPGKLLWAVQEADTAIVDTRKETEDHIALFVWTWDSGTKTGAQEVQITIENLSLHP